ncbi:hypothetical protein LLH06_19380 [Mucilaginibacter daejeonensis]|uniref:hypothetical protein n=1 Tax=Mucilaginibacter daejeonensis TaxID=398049 RepID=UPI001D171A5A|nr:hypothetical protein [Mucilaginibacter daejeonensis]UEG53110.1 hypothetical protein LLH06_19380 [Mucilaginibacter daejeonensis]
MRSFLYYYQGVIVPASTLLPIGAGFLNYKKIDPPLKRLLVYLCGALLINIAGIVVATMHRNNMPGLHLYTLFETVVVMWYYKLAFNDRKLDPWFNLGMIAFPVYCVINFTFFQSIYEYNTYTRPIGAILIIVASIMYLSLQNNATRADHSTTSGRIVAGGFLIYFCSAIIQFIFSNVVGQLASKTANRLIWGMHATLVLIMYIIFLVAFLNERNKR